MRAYKQLLESFLNEAKKQGLRVKPIKVLRTNAYQLGKANVLVRTASDLGKRYFFGLNYINAEEIYNLDSSFVAFVCGGIDKIIFMPTNILVKYLSQISHDRNGEYKINITRDLNLVLKGRNNRLDCASYINKWDTLLQYSQTTTSLASPEQSIHTLIQGRLIEIGNTRGYKTYSPDKSKQFNKNPLSEITTLSKCPNLQFANYSSLRNIDVIWFRKISNGFYPDYAFEVEITTGVWSGFGRLATLRDYNTRIYIVTNEKRRFIQVVNSFPSLKSRCIDIIPEKVGLLYSAEKNLIAMREEFNL
jgi:hypothetical protein